MRIHRGIDLGGTKMLVLDECGGTERRYDFATGREFGPDALERILATLPVAERTGLAVPGLVGGAGEVVESDVLPLFRGWRAPFAAVTNDGEAALLADEGGAAVRMVVGAGTGIVCALSVGGVALRRLRPFAGELGHVRLASGQTLDEAASGAAILRGAGVDGETLRARLAAGDKALERLIAEAGGAFAMGLAILVQVIQPETIGLYGGVLRYPGYLRAAMGQLAELTDPVLLAGCRVFEMPERETVVARGARKAAECGD